MMARLKEKTSNALFDTLQDWESYLRAEGIDFEDEVTRGSDQTSESASRRQRSRNVPQMRGPSR